MDKLKQAEKEYAVKRDKVLQEGSGFRETKEFGYAKRKLDEARQNSEHRGREW